VTPDPRVDWVLIAIEIAGTLAFALSGFIEAARKRMDIVGVAAVTFFAAFGGGTLRDILLDRRPFFWVHHSEYVWAVLALVVIGTVWLRAAHLSPSARPMLWADALGLGLFSASGAGLAWEMGQPAIVCALMGVVTGVFGGVMRDVLCNQVPAIFSDHRPYAVCSFAGAWAFLAVASVTGPAWPALVVGIVVTAGLRLLALARGWRVPGWAER
jgi:uncharacterized membrane protein YeiH